MTESDSVPGVPPWPPIPPRPRSWPATTCSGSAPPQAYLEHFRPLFPRRDQAASFAAYAEGLLTGEQRKSIERMVLREPAAT